MFPRIVRPVLLAAATLGATVATGLAPLAPAAHAAGLPTASTSAAPPELLGRWEYHWGDCAGTHCYNQEDLMAYGQNGTYSSEMQHRDVHNEGGFPNACILTKAQFETGTFNVRGNLVYHYPTSGWQRETDTCHPGNNLFRGFKSVNTVFGFTITRSPNGQVKLREFDPQNPKYGLTYTKE